MENLRQRLRTTNDSRSEKLTWALSSSELKTCNVSYRSSSFFCRGIKLKRSLENDYKPGIEWYHLYMRRCFPRHFYRWLMNFRSPNQYTINIELLSNSIRICKESEHRYQQAKELALSYTKIIPCALKDIFKSVWRQILIWFYDHDQWIIMIQSFLNNIIIEYYWISYVSFLIDFCIFWDCFNDLNTLLFTGESFTHRSAVYDTADCRYFTKFLSWTGL